MPRHRVLVLLLASLIGACSQGEKSASPATAAESAKSASSPSATLLVAPEDLRTLHAADEAQGPVITGTIEPERRADLRAEVSAVVLQVLKENGQTVKQGDLLVRLDDTSIRDGLTSADEAARASGQAFEQAERQYQRMKQLQSQGMSSMQALEDAEIRRNNAQSDLVAAKARAVSARQQLHRTEVRAPFDGVVSDRKASVGDTAAIGKELVKVIDPNSMRFEGVVSADRMSEIQLGQPVSFRVNGYPDVQFAGKVRRVDVAANPTTRQVEVLVDFATGNAPRLAGLYAEGRIASGGVHALMVPEAAIVKSGDSRFVWRVKDKAVHKVAVTLGPRDDRRGEFPLIAGLNDGDQILRNPLSTLVDGQKVELAGSGAGALASAAGSSATARK